jgi:hypothetical protein
LFDGWHERVNIYLDSGLLGNGFEHFVQFVNGSAFG